MSETAFIHAVTTTGPHRLLVMISFFRKWPSVGDDSRDLSWPCRSHGGVESGDLGPPSSVRESSYRRSVDRELFSIAFVLHVRSSMFASHSPQRRLHQSAEFLAAGKAMAPVVCGCAASSIQALDAQRETPHHPFPDEAACVQVPCRRQCDWSSTCRLAEEPTNFG